MPNNKGKKSINQGKNSIFNDKKSPKNQQKPLSDVSLARIKANEAVVKSQYIKQGSNKYVNKETGEVIPRSRFLKESRLGLSPTEYTRLRESEGIAKRQQAPRKDSLRAYLEQTPGGTKKWWQNGGPTAFTPTQRQTVEGRVKAFLDVRYDAVTARREAGLITEKQAERLEGWVRQEHYLRNELIRIYDKINNAKNPSVTELNRLHKEKQRALKHYHEAREKLGTANILPEEGSEWDEVWYH